MKEKLTRGLEGLVALFNRKVRVITCLLVAVASVDLVLGQYIWVLAALGVAVLNEMGANDADKG